MKKMLMLGSTGRGTTELLMEAKKRGIYTVITDNLTVDQSPIKLLADEYWMISTNEVDLLERKCKEVSINGITCGISTFNTSITMELCQRLNLPCYCTPESWHYTIDKRSFKDLCIKHGVPVARDYYISDNPSKGELDEIEFPVVVKAVDLSANRGMSYCFNSIEVMKACEYARSLSGSKTVIIEKMLYGMEYAAWYAMANGEIQLLAFGPMLSQTGYPSNCYSITMTCSSMIKQFEEEVNSNFVKVLKEAGCKEGVGWVEMMLDADGHFYVLEMGYRMSGDMIALPFCDALEFNSYKWLIDIAMGTQHKKQDLPTVLNETCRIACSYILWSKDGGKLTSIEGLEEILKIPGINIDSRLHIGDIVNPYQYLVVITFCAEGSDEVCEIIKMINSSVSIRNEKEDIVIRYVDFDIILQMYGKE